MINFNNYGSMHGTNLGRARVVAGRVGPGSELSDGVRAALDVLRGEIEAEGFTAPEVVAAPDAIEGDLVNGDPESALGRLDRLLTKAGHVSAIVVAVDGLRQALSAVA